LAAEIKAEGTVRATVGRTRADAHGLALRPARGLTIADGDMSRCKLLRGVRSFRNDRYRWKYAIQAAKYPENTAQYQANRTFSPEESAS